MRGHTVKTPERVALAVRMREHGFLFREIATHFDIAISTVDAWVNDPNNAKAHARRARYSKPCPMCGTPMDGSGGLSAAPPLCAECTATTKGEKARARVIDAMHEWHRRFGRPPIATDWNLALARTIGAKASLARRAVADDYDWPASSGVQDLFGSWNAGIEAAGFDAMKPGVRRNLVAA